MQKCFLKNVILSIGVGFTFFSVETVHANSSFLSTGRTGFRESCESVPAKASQYRGMIDQLKKPVLESIGNSDKYLGTTTGVFTNSRDWHSSVHAHWAALSMARISGDREGERQILSRLTPYELQQERTRLTADPSFELPYGRSWLLLLQAELLKHPRSDRKDLSAFKDETTAQVLGWLFEQVNHGEADFCSGDYESGIFTYFLLVESKPSAKFRKDVEALGKSKKLKNCSGRVAQDGDFLNPASLSAILVETSTAASVRLSRKEKSTIDLFSCHKLGVEVSQFWPSAFGAARGSLRDCVKFNRSMRRFMDSPQLWAEDFSIISHWVPQFLWFGIWSALGNP